MCRALILSKKISPRAFKEVVKKGTEAGEVGIEGTTIQQPDQVHVLQTVLHIAQTVSVSVSVGAYTTSQGIGKRPTSVLPAPHLPCDLSSCNLELRHSSLRVISGQTNRSSLTTEQPVR